MTTNGRNPRSPRPYSSPDDEDDGHSEVAADKPSLREHLLWELNMSQLDARDKKIIGLLIDALDENAYLAQPLEEIAELLPPELDITLDDLETALVQLQHLDAPGIGARNLERVPRAATARHAGGYSRPRSGAQPGRRSIWICSPPAISTN